MHKETHTTFNILLADDDEDDHFFFKKALSKITYDIKLVIVQDGERLMKYLSENSEALPDLLFLDLNMPRKKGDECLIEIKADSKLKNLPVIICSTSLREDTADVLYENGAHYYIQKCDMVELSRTLQTLFDKLSENTKRPSRNDFILRLEGSGSGLTWR